MSYPHEMQACLIPSSAQYCLMKPPLSLPHLSECPSLRGQAQQGQVWQEWQEGRQEGQEEQV